MRYIHCTLLMRFKMTFEVAHDEQEAPRFTLPLRDQCVDDGDKVIMKVMFRGNPQPTVTWYFNSQPIKPSADFQINVDFKKSESTLTIVEVCHGVQ